MSEEIGEFRGARKITSLACYPLQYHKNEAQIRKDLIDRGKKFVSLGGVHYKTHQGMAYYKKKKAIIKVNINGRIMVDPSIHRRINPNYPISHVRPKESDTASDDEYSGYDSCGCATESDHGSDGKEKVKYVTKLVKDDKGQSQFVRMPATEEDEEEVSKEKLDKVHSKETAADDTNGEDGKATPTDDSEKAPLEFTDEEYLITSPVVLGFAFAEKLWLEFTVSGVKEIQWNNNAYESLVLEAKTKDIVKVRLTLFPRARRRADMLRPWSNHTSTTPPRASTTSSRGRARASLVSSVSGGDGRRSSLIRAQLFSTARRARAKPSPPRASRSSSSVRCTWCRRASWAPILGTWRLSCRKSWTSATHGARSCCWTRQTCSWRSETCTTSTATRSSASSFAN